MEKLKAKDRIKEIRKQLTALPESEREKLISKVGSLVTVEGRPLSAGNTELCLWQKPDATIVGGFQQWKKAGRCVRKGEHGLSIYIPANSKKEEDQQNTEDDLYFFAGTVFDITQTDEISLN